jgi:putative FmdB family regulatory protein
LHSKNKLGLGVAMPFYEFDCSKCNVNTELQSSMSDDIKSPQCNKCGAEMLRVFSPTFAIFKGSGWGGK